MSVGKKDREWQGYIRFYATPSAWHGRRKLRHGRGEQVESLGQARRNRGDIFFISVKAFVYSVGDFFYGRVSGIRDTGIKIRQGTGRIWPAINRGRAAQYFLPLSSKKRTVWRCHRKTIPFLPANDPRFSSIVRFRSI